MNQTHVKIGIEDQQELYWQLLLAEDSLWCSFELFYLHRLSVKCRSFLTLAASAACLHLILKGVKVAKLVKKMTWFAVRAA